MRSVNWIGYSSIKTSNVCVAKGLAKNASVGKEKIPAELYNYTVVAVLTAAAPYIFWTLFLSSLGRFIDELF